MELTNLFNLLIKVAIMVALGYGLRRRGFIDDALKQKLSVLLLSVVLPLSVVATGNNAFSPEIATGLLWSAVFTVAYFSLALLVMAGVTRRMPLSRPDKGLLAALSVFGNVSFLGYPISFALFGSEGVLYAVVYNLGWQLFVSLFGGRLFDPAGRTSLRTLVRDPLLWAAILSVGIFVSPFRLPFAIVDTFADIGAMAVPISMMIVGCNLAEIKLSRIFTLPGAYVVSALRLLIFPFLMMGALYFLGFRGPVAGTAVLITAMPAGSTNVVFAERYGGNVQFAATAVVQSMVFMVGSLPLLVFFMGRVF